MADPAASGAVLDVPALAKELGERFAAAGHELYLVGGSVRDLVLSRRSPDLDFTTSAHPSDTTATTSQTKQNMANLQVPVRGARGGAPVTKAVILVGNDRDNQYYMNTWLK